MGTEPREVHIRMPWGVLATKTWNSDKLPPVLVVHGSKHNAGSFDGLIPLLSKDYFYVCVDLPGHGYSAAFAPGIPLSFMQYIAALQRLIHYFGWTNFGLIGHSFGAHLVLTLSAAERSKISFLILLDGTARSFLPDEIYLARCTIELEELMRDEKYFYSHPKFTTYEAAVKRFQTAITEKAAKDILARILVKTDQGFYFQMDSRTCFTTMPHMSDKVIFYNCKQIVCPVLVVYPNQSFLHQVHHESEFHKTIGDILMISHRQSRLKYVDGDHCVHCNNPPVVAAVINEFVNDVSLKIHAKMYWGLLIESGSVKIASPSTLLKIRRIEIYVSNCVSHNRRQCAVFLVQV